MIYGTRSSSRFVFSGLLLSSLVAPSCFTTNAGDDDVVEPCPSGQEGCKCKTGSVCDAGLTCNSTKGRCVSATGGSSGAGGSAGSSSNTGGAGARAGMGGSAGSVTKPGTGGDAGAEPSGGASGDSSGGKGGGSTGGKGGSGAQGGSDNSGGEAGVGADGGKGATGGKGGSGGAGAGAGAGAGGMGGSAGASGGKAGGGGSAGSPACIAITLDTAPTAPSASVNSNATSIASEINPELGGLGQDLAGVQFFPSIGGDMTGEITLGVGAEANYETCAYCTIVTEDDGDKMYFATSGTLTLDPSGHHLLGYPKGTLSDVTFVEVTVNMDNGYHSTPVPGGACLTLADGDALVNIQPPIPGWYNCPAAYYGDGFCDCGCGAFDPDCTSSTDLNACAYCWCEGDGGSCDDPNGVLASDTGTCEQ